jgi:hypothetical protein
VVSSPFAVFLSRFSLQMPFLIWLDGEHRRLFLIYISRASENCLDTQNSSLSNTPELRETFFVLVELLHNVEEDKGYISI